MPPPYRPVVARPAAAATARPGTPIQRYQTLPPAKIYQQAPAKRPWFGYPYAITGAAAFHAQVKADGVGDGDEFLPRRGAAAANIVNHGGTSLRLSNNNDMAIEDSDLQGRQPKVFFATQAVVNTGNRLLAGVGSPVSLQTGGGAGITIWTGWYAQQTLVRVTPLFNGGSPDNLPQNCNAIAAVVTGWDAEHATLKSKSKALETVARVAPTARRDYTAAFHDTKKPFDEPALINAIAAEYVSSATDRDVEAVGANRHARPEVGESYMIATVGKGTDLGSGRERVRDYASGQDRDLGWGFHFGGVVARSGGDRITLENYARGDNRQAHADPRWYFQMYGEERGQSFHEFHEARRDYANPITLTVNKGTKALPVHAIDR